MAITCGAEIVPIALVRDGKDYYCSLGENIVYDGCAYEERLRLTNKLRDRMATLKWELVEQIPQVKRCEVPETAYDDFVNRMRFCLEESKLVEFRL